jgi:hypothetical protein
MDENLGATADAIEPEEIEQSKSMDDTIRETLHSLQDRGIETEPADVVATPEENAQRIRDGQGKFAAKSSDIPADTIIDPAVQIDQVSVAPNTWKKEAAEAWIKADPIIRAEVERREADFHKGIEQYRVAATFAQTMERAITPYAATLQSLNISPDRAVGELMAADQRMRNGDIQYFAQLAKSYNFNPSQLVEIFGGQQSQEQQYVDPNMSALKQQVSQLTGYIQNQQSTAQQQAQETLNSEISTFAADPSHSHFEAVRGHMSALLQAGQAKDLPDAYEQAIYANPTTRTAVLQQQAAAQREEATKKAQAAKSAASVNVRSRPSMPVSQPIGTMDDTIRANYRRMIGT